MEPQTPTTPEQPSSMGDAPAPMPTSQEPMSAAQPVAAPTTAPSGANPGHGMGIAGLVLAFFAPVIGLVLSIIAMNKSKKAGMKNGMALAGLIISIINVIAGAIIAVVLIGATAAVVQKCEELGPGTHIEDGVTYTCD